MRIPAVGEGGAAVTAGESADEDGDLSRTPACRAPRFDELDEAARTEFWAVLALRHTEGIGGRSLHRLIRAYGSAYDAVRRAPHWGGSGLRSSCAQAVASGTWRRGARSEWDAVRDCGCGILLWNDRHYPARLGHLPDSPAVLYCTGDIGLLGNPALGIVGSRLCSREGMRTAARLASDLSRAGVTIVSGMARGIDREAHLAGLGGVGGTIGVLGTGVDVRYPADNRDLYAVMQRRGLLVTEFAPGARPDSRHFPIRNRVISGLSLGVLVVEAAMRSGSLITARLALEQGREVYAIPGPASAQTSRGCHDLLSEGARAVSGAEEILADLAPQLLESLRQGRAASPTGAAAVEPPAPARRGGGVPSHGSAFSENDVEGRDGTSSGVERLMGRVRAHLLQYEAEAALRGHAAPNDSDHCGGSTAGGARSLTAETADGAQVAADSASPVVARATSPVASSARRVPQSVAGAECPAVPGAGLVDDASITGATAANTVETPCDCPPDGGLPPDGPQDDEGRLLGLLATLGEAHIDDLCRQLDMAPGTASGILLLLEVQGEVRRLPGMRYARM